MRESIGRFFRIWIFTFLPADVSGLTWSKGAAGERRSLSRTLVPSQSRGSEKSWRLLPHLIPKLKGADAVVRRAQRVSARSHVLARATRKNGAAPTAYVCIHTYCTVPDNQI